MDTDVLRHAPLFSALDDDAAASLRSSLGTVKLRRGEVLFHEGDTGDKLYIVGEGKVKLGRTSADGRENLLAILGPGQMFGELSLFDPGPRSATVTAVTVAERGPGSKSESSPNIWPGPRIARRFSRPSLEVRPSFTLPSATM